MIVSLFDWSGEWIRPYAEAGFTTIQVDKENNPDAPSDYFLTLDIGDPLAVMRAIDAIIGKDSPVFGVLAAPVCTHMTTSGAQYWKAKDRDGRTDEGMKLFHATLDLIDWMTPGFWALENPVGRLPAMFPQRLGNYVMTFNPCDYGDAYNKRTCLWGRFNPNLPLNKVDPERVCSQGSWVQKLGGSSARTKRLRSMTPPGFSRAFFQVNH